jgi:hypothetical protein
MNSIIFLCVCVCVFLFGLYFAIFGRCGILLEEAWQFLIYTKYLCSGTNLINKDKVGKGVSNYSTFLCLFVCSFSTFGSLS